MRLNIQTGRRSGLPLMMDAKPKLVETVPSADAVIKRMRHIALSAIILCAVSVPALAQAPNCAGIADDRARLACYDGIAKTKTKDQPTSPKSSLDARFAEQDRLSYRGRLERAMLESGSSAEVLVEGTKLTIWTYLNRAIVFKLITDGKILDGAKEAGFKTVDFFDRGHEGHWIYDLTKPSNCDVSQRLCY